MIKKWIVLLCCLLALTLTAACGGDTAVATVNGEKVTVKEFNYYWENLSGIYAANDETLDDSLKETVAEQLVYYELLEQTAAKLDCLPAADEAQAYFEEQLANVYGSYEKGLEEIKNYGLDQDFFYAQYRYELMENKIKVLLGKKENVSIGEDEARAIYEADPARYNTRKVSHILIKPYAADNREAETDDGGNQIYTAAEWQTAKARAEKIIAELKDGADFKTLAIKYSDDTATAASGGVIDENLTEDNTDLEASFVKAAFTLDKAGDYTVTPVKTSYGYHILYCDGILSPDDMDAVLAYIIKTETAAKEQTLLTSYMDKQKDAAEIDYHMDVLESS